MNGQEFMVYVSCITYNQANYIKDALDGFCMQQTEFPFICGIIDDASTDGEPIVIQNYLEKHFDLDDKKTTRFEETENCKRVFARHKINKNCFFVVVYLKYNHYQIKKSKLPYIIEWSSQATYIAENEGDDYWIDPLKLQKQVDFMDKHPNHSLCFSAYQRLLPSGELQSVLRYNEEVEHCSMEDIIMGGGGYMATNSMLYRQSLYVPYSSWAVGCPIGDLPMMLSLAIKGDVGYSPDIMCVYRVSSIGSWTATTTNNKKKRRSHYEAIKKMWTQFDEWSEKKYHKLIKRKLFYNKKQYLRTEISMLKNKLFGL